MADKPWKVLERHVNEFFGGKGRAKAYYGWQKGNSDIIHDLLHVQCKYRQKWSIINLWRDVRGYAKGKIPVVAIRDKGGKGFWLLIHSKDLTAVANQRVKNED